MVGLVQIQFPLSHNSKIIRHLSVPTSGPISQNTKDAMSLEQSRLPNGLDESRRNSLASRKANKESREQSRHSFASYTSYEEELPDVFTDMDEPCVMEEATVMDAREVTIETPRLPEKSALRASRFLDNLKRNSIGSMISDLPDVYLSSEEDASSSADDFSDYDTSSDESESSPVRRKSREESARAVSVIFVGRPCVVDLASGRRSVSPIRRPRTISLSTSIQTDLFEDRPSLPPRKSSLVSAADLPKESPSFLNQDPFAANNYKLEQGATPAGASPRVKSAAFHRFQKSLSLVRKRSRPNLKDAASRDSFASSSVSNSTTDISLSPNASHTSEDEPKQTRAHRLSSATTTPPQTPVTYNDIITSSRRNSLPRVLTKQPPQPSMSPSPVSGKKGLLSGLNINRRRSIRIKP
ncbi:hypothetical protein F5Y05DRAFT_394234 [Hypoxylon sp. FL0543]|nr:hypothetical protein F5Y05DRAFT_394234 [Hypoxylon sp. FL0543]